jgi:predicted signal transduction protein with EAL and GGDEF domain
LLKEIGNRLSTLVRHEDIVARLGGDEFIILLHDVEMPNGPETVANKIIDSFVSPFDIEGRETFITASLGISIFPNDGEEAETLLQNADAAMYKSKEQGRNTFRFFTPGLNDQAVQHSRIAERLRHALDRGDFELYFQPVVDILKDKVVSIEALIRWDDAVLKAVDPEQLISVAEETGFILPIDEWVLDEACRHVASWRADVAPSLQLNVNISSSHFRNAYLVEVVKLALEKSHLPAQALTIEITENVLIGETPEILQRLNKLTDIGVKLTLDDFGTGYSSLGCLKRFKVNGLKIDRSFIRDIPEVPGDLALIEAIIAMSNSLGLSVIAEGVEKPEQLELLRKRGCHLIQGFHFSEPLSVDEMTNYLSVEIKS